MSFRRLQGRREDMCFFVPMTDGEEYRGNALHLHKALRYNEPSNIILR